MRISATPKDYTTPASLQYFDIKFTIIGNHHFFYLINGLIAVYGCIIVEPKLIGGEDEESDINPIRTLTVHSEYLGDFYNWKEKLEIIHKIKYNLICLTAIQKLNFNLADFAKLVKFMRKEWKMISITDIVLNHIANETPWLKTDYSQTSLLVFEFQLFII